jgi:hypothetical protein
LAKVRQEIANIVAAIREGRPVRALATALETLEAEEEALARELAAAAVPTVESVATMLPRAAERYRELVANLETVVQRDVARARTHVAALLGGGEIKLVPASDGFLDAELRGDCGAALRLGASAGQVSRVAGERNQRYLQLFRARIPRIG